MRVNQVSSIKINEFLDSRGSLRVIEDLNLTFNVKRVYWLADLRKGSKRGVHAHKKLQQIYLPIQGEFSIKFHDGLSEITHKISTLNKSGLHVPSGLWREITGIANNNLLLVLASEPYDRSDYIFNFDEYIGWKSLND